MLRAALVAARRLAQRATTRPLQVHLRNSLIVGGPMTQHVCHKGSSAMRSARVVMRKKFGQHLLRNPDVVKAIVDSAQIQPHESVFEIGPGTGNMTVHLLQAARVVYAVELDTRLYDILLDRVAALGPDTARKLQVVRADFLSVPLPPFDALVANIPYQISSPVLHRLFSHTPLPSRAVIMFQKEFADRMVARPGTAHYCRLSVNTQLLAAARIVMNIDRNQFRPPPRVDSAVVRLEPRGWPAGLDWPQWDGMLRLCFAGKNKKLRSVLAGSKTVLAKLTALRVPSLQGAPGNTVGVTAEGASAPAAAAPAAEPSQLDTAVDKDDDIIVTADGRFPRSTLLATREDILRVLDGVGLTDARANALPIPSFQTLYDAMRAAGFTFPTARTAELDHTAAFSVHDDEEEQKDAEGATAVGTSGGGGSGGGGDAVTDAVTAAAAEAVVQQAAAQPAPPAAAPVAAPPPPPQTLVQQRGAAGISAEASRAVRMDAKALLRAQRRSARQQAGAAAAAATTSTAAAASTTAASSNRSARGKS